MEIFKANGFDKMLFFTTLILISFGLVMVFSSSAILAAEKYNRPFHFFINQIIVAAIGVFLIILMLSTKKAFYQDNRFIYFLLFLSLFLLVLCLVMPSAGKTNRWVNFSGIRFQPSELAKISLILFFSSYIERKKDNLNELKSLLIPIGVLTLFIFLILKEPDYGTAIIISTICLTMLFIGGLKFRYFIYLGIFSFCLFGFYLLKATYRLTRISAFLYPTRDPLGSGFQVIQSKLAVGSGGLFGVSLGESTQKLFFLPCAHTDYIYAIIGEELGLLGTLSILLLFLILLWRGLLISSRAPNLFSQIAASGLTLAIFSQALLNISVVLGLIPPTGVPLPLISFGRSSLVCTLFSLGILLHISQRKTTVRQKNA